MFQPLSCRLSTENSPFWLPSRGLEGRISFRNFTAGSWTCPKGVTHWAVRPPVGRASPGSFHVCFVYVFMSSLRLGPVWRGTVRLKSIGGSVGAAALQCKCTGFGRNTLLPGFPPSRWCCPQSPGQDGRGVGWARGGEVTCRGYWSFSPSCHWFKVESEIISMR